MLIANGDAHLKNWSLIYRDPRIPTLSPAYDLVATAPPYRRAADGPEDLALKLGCSRRFKSVSLASFARLERRLGVRAGLMDLVADLVDRVGRCWPEHSHRLSDNDALRTTVGESIARTAGRCAQSAAERDAPAVTVAADPADERRLAFYQLLDEFF